MSEPSYHHTQKAPWFLLLFGFAGLFFTVAWVTRAEPVLPAILLVSGLLMATLGYSMQQLTVNDEGDRLAICFGPLPLFRKRIRYDDIIGVEIGRTTIMDGWGIHWSPWGGWVWNIWGRDCVVIRHQRGITRVGTDDAEGLAEFLKTGLAANPGQQPFTEVSPMLNRKIAFLVLSVAVLATASAHAQYHIYWGDMHGHTANSDGKGSLDDYFIHARDAARLDFVVVSDHDFGNAAPWHMPKETWTLTQDKVDQYTVNGKFVAIAGYEWTSQPKYWTPEEPIFTGPAKFYNHKNVYFPARVEYLFSAKDPAYNSPNLLAQAVQKVGGLIQNNHPIGEEARDQWDYTSAFESVIVNTEMGPDVIRYDGKEYKPQWEAKVREFLKLGRTTGFVAGSDTHEGKPVARTAVLARGLTRPAIFEALRHRRNYAVFNAKIVLDFKIDGHVMGEEIEIQGKPRIAVGVQGTNKIEEVAIVRDGTVLHSLQPGTPNAKFEYVDEAFCGNSYYYVRVIQADKDEHGNRSHAWSSPIWVKKK